MDMLLKIKTLFSTLLRFARNILLERSREQILLLVLFLIIFFLRFFRVPELFFFGIDEEYQSLLALSIIKDFHIIWIGLSAADTGFYVGPGLVYLHAFLLWISRLDPVILAYSASAIGFFTIIILYFITKNLFERKTAIIATVFYAFSPYILSYDRRFWNSTLVPLASLIIFLSLVKSGKDARWYILLFIILGLSFHIHASLLVYIPISLALLLYRGFKGKFKINYPIALISIVLFLLIYSPLIVYDLVHNFDNLKTPLRMLQAKSGIHFLDYYLLGFFPFVAIVVGVLLKRINRSLLIFFAALYIIAACVRVFSLPLEGGLAAKKILIKKTLQVVGDQSFLLTTGHNYLYFGGWRYLFEAYGGKPTASQADEMFGWIYPKEISSTKPPLIVLISEKNVKQPGKIISKIHAGQFNAFIIKND